MTEAGPGIIWSVIPLEVVINGLAPVYPPTVERVVEGRVLQVELAPDGTETVVRLISGQAQDYLEPRFQPGAVVRRGAEG